MADTMKAKREQLIRSIQTCEQEAHRLGLTQTGHALNNALNTIGWELAGNSERAALAAKGKRQRNVEAPSNG